MPALFEAVPRRCPFGKAVPTAEGALQVAMEHLPVTLRGAQCLVLGYGRIGKLLSHRLQGLEARVTVAARKYADLAWAEAYGLRALPINRLSGALGGMQVIFNTVPLPSWTAGCWRRRRRRVFAWSWPPGRGSTWQRRRSWA